ncbi:hypothetical protein ACH4MG_38415, partial [Streptomyces sp. NPDC017454]|uniref:scabin-related ADP-ribosyltransferase n=1 Tax=Streptomyces sp. NPDC017454 TaxID=3364997 RepID=UPI0037B67E07
MGKFENPQSHIVITSDHLQQIADVLTPYLPIGARALQDRVAADGAAGGEADAGVERPTTRPATESAALSDDVSPAVTQETRVSGDAVVDAAPAVDYRMVHELDRDYVVESLKGEKLWRFSNHPPEEIFREGFHADNPENVVDLFDWSCENPDAQFVSTTRNQDLWFKDHKGKKRYRYGIDSSRNGDPTGVDVNATFDRAKLWHAFPEEQEVAFTGLIDARAVVSVYDRELGRTGTWNPDTDEVKWRKGVHDAPSESLSEFAELDRTGTWNPDADEEDADVIALADLAEEYSGPAVHDSVEVPRTSQTESADSGLVAGGGKRHGGSEPSADEDDTDRSAQHGPKRRRIEVEAVTGGGGEGVGDEGASSGQADPEAASAAFDALLGSESGPQSVSTGGPADVDMEGSEEFAGSAGSVGLSYAVGEAASGAVGASDMVQQAETDEQTVPEAVDAARRAGPGVLSLGDGRVEDSSTQAGGAEAVPSAGPSVLSEGSSPGRLLGSGEVRTDRFIPRSGEAFVVEVGEGGLPGRVLPGGSRKSGEWTEVGFLWEWYAGDRPGQETVRLTRRIFLDDQGVDSGRVEVMRRNAFAGLAELNAQGSRLPAVQPEGLVHGPHLPGPRLELAVEFVDSEADAHDVVQVKDGQPQAPGDMVQNVWYTQASRVLLAHEIAHGYGPRDVQAHDDGARDGERALLASPRDEQGRPLGVRLTSHGDEAQQAGEGRWDLMGPINLGEPGRSYGLTPHELGQIADILSPFLHHGVGAPKPRVVQETAYARPAAPVRSDEGLGFEDGLGFDVDMESGDFGDFGVFPGDDGEVVGSRAWAGGSVDEDAAVFALAEEYSGPAVRPGAQAVAPAADGVDDGVEAPRTSQTEFAESGLVAGGGKRHGGSEPSVDEDDTDQSAQHGPKRRRIEVEAVAGGGGEGVREEGADSDQAALEGASVAIAALLGSDFGPQSVSPGEPADVDMEGSEEVSAGLRALLDEARLDELEDPPAAGFVDTVTAALLGSESDPRPVSPGEPAEVGADEWAEVAALLGSESDPSPVSPGEPADVDMEGSEEFAGSAGSVGLSSAVGEAASGAVGASDRGGAGSDVRLGLKEAVDDLRSKLRSLNDLFDEIGAGIDDRAAIQDEDWEFVSSKVVDAIHRYREKYRDAPRYADGVKVAREQLKSLLKWKPYVYIAGHLGDGTTAKQLSNFNRYRIRLPLATLKRIDGLYAAEVGTELPVEPLGPQQSFLKEAVDDLVPKLSSLNALRKELERLGVRPRDGDMTAIKDEEWDRVSSKVVEAIHLLRDTYRDAPQLKVARQQLEWLHKERGFAYIADYLGDGTTAKKLEECRYGRGILPLATWMRIADLYAVAGGPELPVQRLHPQRSFSEDVPAGLSAFLDEARLDELEDLPAPVPSDEGLGFDEGLGSESDPRAAAHPVAGAADGEADAVVVRPTAQPATESVALSDDVSPAVTQETRVSGDAAVDAAPAVDYRMVHELDRDYVVESLKGEKLWRFSNRPPEEIFRVGFHADDPESVVDLRKWARRNPAAQFVSTTRDRELWHRSSRFRYGIDSSRNGDPTGVDVNGTFDRQAAWNSFPMEREVTFTGLIDARAVVSVYDRELDRTGTWNPDTDEVEWREGVHDAPPESLSEFAELDRTGTWNPDADESGPGARPVGQVNTSPQSAAGDGSGDVVAAGVVQQAEINEQTLPRDIGAVRRPSPGVSLESDGRGQGSSTGSEGPGREQGIALVAGLSAEGEEVSSEAGGAGTVPSAAPSVLSGGSSGPGRLLGSGEV